LRNRRRFQNARQRRYTSHRFRVF